jgi:hypothetical protein
MKHEWRKREKAFYLPKASPEIIDVPAFKFFTIEGKGNPNDDHFPEYIGVLYAVSYAVKMSVKRARNQRDILTIPFIRSREFGTSAKKQKNAQTQPSIRMSYCFN